MIIDAVLTISDLRHWCEIYRKEVGQPTEVRIGAFWGRIANMGRQTTGLETVQVSGDVTGTLWVLRIPPRTLTLHHEDQVQVGATRYRVIQIRPVTFGQIAILSSVQ